MVSKKIKTLTASTAVAAGLALSAPAALAAPADSQEPAQETSAVDQLSSVVTPELLEQLLGLSSNSEAASTAADSGTESTESATSADSAASTDSAATATPSADGEAAKSEKSELVTTLPEGATKLQPKEGNKTISGKLVSTVKPEAVSITLSVDGTLSFEDGCNGGTAEYSFDSEGALEVGSIASTRMACEPAAMADAAAMTKILESKPAIYQLDDSTLALAAGDDAIEFKPAQAEESDGAPATEPEAAGAASDETPATGAEVNQDASQAGNTGAETANVDDEGVVQPDTTADQTGPAGATA